MAQAAYQRIEPALTSEGVAIVKHAEDADCRLVFGGDGTMLQEARRDLRRGYNGEPVPIFGIKAGNPRSMGMLLNDVAGEEPDAVIEAIRNGIYQRFYYLKVVIEGINGNSRTEFVFNDVTTIRANAQTAATNVFLDGRLIKERAMGDGMLICTPQGSAAYSLKAGGTVTPDLGTIQLTGIVSDLRSLAFREDALLRLEVLEAQKRPQRAEGDGRILMRKIRAIEARKSKIFSTIMFMAEQSFNEKMIAEALRTGRR